MKRLVIFWLVLLIVLAPLVGCGSSKKETQASEEALKREKIALELADKYQAVLWRDEDCIRAIR